MNSDFVVFNAQGRILRTGSAPEDSIPLQALAEESIAVLKADPATEYVEVDDGTARVAPRPPSSITIVEHAGLLVQFSGVAFGALLLVAGDSHMEILQERDDGAMAITLPSAGRYLILCEKFPQQQFRAVVNVT